jgi:hypothetical protein
MNYPRSNLHVVDSHLPRVFYAGGPKYEHLPQHYSATESNHIALFQCFRTRSWLGMSHLVFQTDNLS